MHRSGAWRSLEETERDAGHTVRTRQPPHAQRADQSSSARIDPRNQQTARQNRGPHRPQLRRRRYRRERAI